MNRYFREPLAHAKHGFVFADEVNDVAGVLLREDASKINEDLVISVFADVGGFAGGLAADLGEVVELLEDVVA